MPADVAVVGTDEAGTEFSRVVLDDEAELDLAAAEADLLRAARELVRRHPDTGAILLECTNMVPYAAAVGAATGLPVFDMYDFVCWFQQSLKPRRFPPPR